MLPILPSRLSVLLIVLVALPPKAALAQATPAPDIGGGFFQLLFGLGVVIILLFASLWLLKRLSELPSARASGSWWSKSPVTGWCWVSLRAG